MAQLNRVLKTGGKLIIAHALSSTEIIVHHHHSSVVAHDALPDKAEMKRLLERAGFTGIHITDEPGCYVCLSTKPSANALELPKFKLMESAFCLRASSLLVFSEGLNIISAKVYWS